MSIVKQFSEGIEIFHLHHFDWEYIVRQTQSFHGDVHQDIIQSVMEAKNLKKNVKNEICKMCACINEYILAR